MRPQLRVLLAASAGFGDSHNTRPRWDNSMIVFNNQLYVGTENRTAGGQVWGWYDLEHDVDVPAVLR